MQHKITIYNEIHTLHLQIYSYLVPTDSLFLAILLVKQNFKLVWPIYTYIRLFKIDAHTLGPIITFCTTIYMEYGSSQMLTPNPTT